MPTILLTALSTATPTPSPTTAADAVDQVGEGVSFFVELIDKYGPVITILSVFLVVFLVLLYMIIKSNRKMMDTIIKSQTSSDEVNQKLVEKIVDACVVKVTQANKESLKETIDEHDRKERDSHKTILSVYIDANLAFKDASRIAMEKTKCQRVAIYLFHNGNSTPYGYPFAKMSCVHEWTMKGSNTIRGRSHNDIPLYAFSNIVEALTTDNELAIGDIYNHSVVTSDEQTIQFVSGSTAKALFALGIKDNSDTIVAFTVAEFKEAQDFTDIDLYKKVKEALHTMNQNIYSIIVNDEFKEKFSGESK